MWQNKLECLNREYLRGKYHCTVDLLFDWFRLVCFANKNKKYQLSYSESQTSQTRGHGTVILPHLVFPGLIIEASLTFSIMTPFRIVSYFICCSCVPFCSGEFHFVEYHSTVYLDSAWPDSSIFCQFGYFLKLVVIFWKGDILGYFLLLLFFSHSSKCAI